MKLRRPRTKSVAWWTSVLAGGAILLVVALSHPAGWGASNTNTLWVRGWRPALGHIDFARVRSELYNNALALPAPIEERVTFDARGVYASVFASIGGERVELSLIDSHGRRELWASRSLLYSRVRFALRAAEGEATVYVAVTGGVIKAQIESAWLWATGTPLFVIPAAQRARALERRFHAKRRRRHEGTCNRCGYDLAGLPSGAACPECGA